MTSDSAGVVAGLLAGSVALLATTRRVLEGEWGAVAVASEPRPWAESAYYERDMGPGLLRQFLGFERPAGLGALAGLKRRAVEMEAELAKGAEVRRPVNIDPGLLDAHSVTLASTKRAGHRVSIGGGMWAEIALLYREGAYRAVPWTYPDYAWPEAIAFFGAFRKVMLPKLK